MTGEAQSGMLLVIERDSRFTEKFKKHLKVAEMRPFFVESGKDALFLLESMNASFLLINLNGIQTWEELRGLMDYATNYKVPYLFIEGLRKTQGVADRLREKGYTHFIKLPFSIKTLIKQITKLLTRETLLHQKIGPEGFQVEILHKLGKGASGQVYQACQPSLERNVAVKFMGEELLDDRDAIERFHREARAIAQMKSPHIVGVYYVGTHQKRPYLVMEYISGPTLEKYLRGKGRLKPSRALKIVREVLVGLIEAHGHDKIHRDLKPANIMLNRNGQAVILDFGLVRETNAQNLTKAGMVMGTPRYISPEQVQGHQMDQRCDLYSLGIILYEMLVGRPPFGGEDFVSVLWKHVRSPLPSPAEFGVELDPELYAIIGKLTEKDPEKRFSSAIAALRTIDLYLESTSQSGLSVTRGETRELIQQMHPIGGLAINESGELIHQFGETSNNRAKALHALNNLLSQLQGLETLGGFNRGLISSGDDHKWLVFNCFDGLAAIETADTDVTTKFNMMHTADLAALFRGEVVS